MGHDMDACVQTDVMGLPLKRNAGYLGGWYNPPNYSTDLSAAWLVVEKMRANGLRPVFTPDWGHQWSVVVYNKDEYIGQTEWYDSLPEAICVAAILTIPTLNTGTNHLC